jgi:hypothetical protein
VTGFLGAAEVPEERRLESLLSGSLISTANAAI